MTSGRTTARLCVAIATTAVLALLVGRALELRLVQFSRPFWEDEVHHNYVILSARNVKELLALIAGHGQPCFEYVLRKLFWFPLLGHQERSLRLPSLAYSLLTVISGFAVSFWFFRNKGSSVPLALGLSALVGLWITGNPLDVHHAAEARHYGLVALLSLAWSAVYFCPARVSPFPLFLVSLLFANTHFFALPLVSAAYLFELMPALRKKAYRPALVSIGSLAGILYLTCRINRQALACFTKDPPSRAAVLDLVQGFRGGFEVWWQYSSYLALPFSALLVWLCLVPAFRRPAVAKLLAVLFLVLPALFVYLRLQSSYPFGDRYYTPFFGPGFVSVLFFLQLPQELARRLPAFQRTGSCLRVQAASTAVVGTALCLGMAALAARVYADRAALTLPPPNFSPHYLLYEELKKEQAPLFILHNRIWAEDIALLYMKFIGRPYHAPFGIASSAGHLIGPATAREAVRSFLESNPAGVIALDQVPTSFPTDLSPDAPGKEHTTRVEEISPPAYWPGTIEAVHPFPGLLWKVRGARSLEDVARAAAAVRFQAAPGVFESLSSY